MQPLYLIDAYGLIYRYYFAFITRPLRNSAGENVSALFGFARALVNLIAQKKPSYMAAVFDSHTPTFRHEMYKDYKATREKAPTDLHAQVPIVMELLTKLGVPILSKDGFEADDIIATLAQRCKNEGRHCYIVSNDKDLLQLAGGGVWELRVSKDQDKLYEEIGADEVKALWGVPPKNIIDVLALMGDASDNVPGVKGIGEKTAVRLASRFGSLDNIYANIAGIEGAASRRLAEGKEDAYLSRKLIELRKDIELDLESIESLAIGNFDGSAANEVLLRHNIKEVRFAASSYAETKPIYKKKSTDLVNAQTFDEAFAAADKNCVTLDADALASLSEAQRGVLLKWTQSPKNFVKSEDIKEVYKVSRRAGLPPWKCKMLDTKILRWLSGKDNWTSMSDAEITAETPLPEIYTSMEAPLIPVLAEMELKGVKIEKSSLASYAKELSEELNSIQNEIWQLSGHEFNISSPKQLQKVLFVERHLAPGKKNRRGYSTAADVLSELAREDPLAVLVLRFRQLSKLKATYVDTLPLDADAAGRIHTTFDQTGTATGRLSSHDPNLQNIPVREAEGRRIRESFIAEKGSLFISADYSQIELAVLAHLSADAKLCDAFNTGKDVHRRTAALIFGAAEEAVTNEQRRIAKVINFGVIYGMSAFRLANELGISRREAAAFIDSYFKTYSGVRDFIAEVIRRAEKDGYVETLFGRRRWTPEINSPNKTVKSAVERIAVNTPIQGTAADIVKIAMLNVNIAISDTDAALLLQVHDELIFECPENSAAYAAAKIKDVMERCVKLRVPLRVSIETGKRWGSFH